MGLRRQEIKHHAFLFPVGEDFDEGDQSGIETIDGKKTTQGNKYEHTAHPNALTHEMISPFNKFFI